MSDLWAGGLLGCVLTFVALFVLAVLAGRPGCSRCDDYEELNAEHNDALDFLVATRNDLETLLDAPDDKLREGVEQITEGVDDWLESV